jgi:hypothetical protein
LQCAWNVPDLARAAPVAVAFVAALPAWAETAPEPPLWANLAECSAVFEAAASVSDSYSGAKPEDIARASEVAGRFLAQAVTEASAVGQQDPAADVHSILGHLRERWQNRTSDIFSVPSNLKWIDYCGRLARQTGVLPLHD